MLAFLLVGFGGALGSMARYGVGLALPSSGFPYATLAVNVIGCFCIGMAMPAAARVEALSPELRLLVVVGFLGGFTTFSASRQSRLCAGWRTALLNVPPTWVWGLPAEVLRLALSPRELSIPTEMKRIAPAYCIGLALPAERGSSFSGDSLLAIVGFLAVHNVLDLGNETVALLRSGGYSRW